MFLKLKFVKMKRKLFLLALNLFLLLGNISAQAKTIDIWNGNTPGAISDTSYQLITDFKNNRTYLQQVVNPELDFFPAKAENNTGTAVIICPGGGYMKLSYTHEGKEIAEWFNSFGINAFVLKSRLPSDKIMTHKSVGPLQDAQEAMRIVRRNANIWNIDAHKIGIMGFSAGGHLAASLSTHYADSIYPSDKTSARPDFSILIYPVISMDTTITHKGSRTNLLGKNPTDKLVEFFSNEKNINTETPPAFLAHAMNDKAVPVQNSINYALALNEKNIPVELHIYEKGGHGFGISNPNSTESSWTKACKFWLETKNND